MQKCIANISGTDISYSLIGGKCTHNACHESEKYWVKLKARVAIERAIFGGYGQCNGKLLESILHG